MANLLQTVSKQYDKLYNPQINVKKQQLSALGSAFEPQRQALEQAKVNAFRGFDSNAAGRNVFYSGYRPEAQAQYIGETYTPELAKIGANEASQRLGLLEQLNELLINRGKDVFGRVDTIADRQLQARIARERLSQEQRISNQQLASQKTII